MRPRPQTPVQLAEALFDLTPSAITPAVLEEYGIEATAEQASRITRELLSLNLFWMYSAIETMLAAANREPVLLACFQRLHNTWAGEFGFADEAFVPYFRELDARRVAYDQIVRQGGGPVTVFTEAAEIMESGGMILAEDKKKILAVLIDLVPVDAYGHLTEESATEDR